jgi:hypothetical protein
MYWIRLLMGANFLEFNGVALSVVGDVPIDSEVFINLKDLSAHSSKMLIKIGFADVCSQR